ncbi:SUMF1/EgtB/PvdO family nonheme iron enzyme, partial [bacterium]|nr:SUMF1/EgtB/PvdO family nonheme iron enzyme [bacterium]
MHGNVWEWCQDAWDEKYYKQSPKKDPINQSKEYGASRVIRGGSWNDGAGFCRSACRFGYRVDSRYYFIGCRIALSRT